MPNRNNPLQRQLDQQKFLHAIEYVRSHAFSIKKISTTEISRTNQYLSGSDEDPWRFDAIEVSIPGGSHYKMDVIQNPIERTRTLIGDALQMSGNGQGLEAAHYLYSQLVLNHVFKVANRRTAVAAALWILLISGYDCNPEELLAYKLGDLRKESDLLALKAKMQSLVTQN